jgi:type II secretory pathway component HofQ
MEAYQGGDLAGAKGMLEAIAQRDPRNQTVRTYLRMIAEKQAAQLAAKRRLDAIVIPKLEVRDVPAREAFDYAIQLINKNSTDGKKTNIVWMVPADYAGRVTLSLQDVPASEALKYLGNVGGLNVAIEEYAVKISTR